MPKTFVLRKLKITKVDLCRAGANPDADIVIFKSRDNADPAAPNTEGSAPAVPSTPNTQENTTVKKVASIDLTKASAEEILAYAKALETSVAEHEAELAKAVPPAPKGKKKDGEEAEEENPFAKSAEFIALQKQVTDQAAEIKKANDKLVAAEEEVRKANIAAEIAVVEKSVSTDMPNIPGTVQEVAKMLHEAKSALTAASFATLEKALKAGNEAIAKASQELGSSKGKSIGSAEEELFKAADALVQAGTFKTRPEAVAHVSKTNKELAEAYRVEKAKK